jgi:acyl-CoA thioester hydrolase
MRIRVYYEDTDSGGVVYHSNYLNFMERARTEWLRNLGINQYNLKLTDNMIFIVANLDIKYKKSALLDDELQINTKLENIKACALLLQQEIYRDTELLTVCSIKVACVDATKFNPLKIPSHIKKLMEPL